MFGKKVEVPTKVESYETTGKQAIPILTSAPNGVQILKEFLQAPLLADSKSLASLYDGNVKIIIAVEAVFVLQEDEYLTIPLCDLDHIGYHIEQYLLESWLVRHYLIVLIILKALALKLNSDILLMAFGFEQVDHLTNCLLDLEDAEVLL